MPQRRPMDVPGAWWHLTNRGLSKLLVRRCLPPGVRALDTPTHTGADVCRVG